MAPSTEIEAERFVRNLGEIQREKWENVDDLRGAIERLLKIWYDPCHILIELLQNADDEGKEGTPNDCEFILNEDGLIFRHHGYPFEEKHVETISKINKTTKKPGSHIGYMGIGFKSVFKLTDSPYIFCEPFRFRFSREDVIVPRWVEKAEVPEPVGHYLDPSWTTFYLPFAKGQQKIEVRTILMAMDPVVLIFLNKTRSITVRTDEEVVCLTKENISTQSGDSKYILVVHEVRNGEKKSHNFLVYERKEPVDPLARDDREAKECKKAELEEVNITLAFPLDSQGDFETKKRPLYTFLPTRYNPCLRFVVSSDFILDSARGEPMWSSAWNIWLLKSVAKILTIIVEDLKKEKRWREKIYKILPRKSETVDPIREYVTKPLLSRCSDSSVVLTRDEEWAKPAQCVIADETLQDLVQPEKLGYQFYVNPRVEAKEFLVEELNVYEIKADQERKIIFHLLEDRSYLAQRDTMWFLEFYEFLYERFIGNKAWKINPWELDELLNKFKEVPLIKTLRGLAKPDEAILPPTIKEELARIPSLPYLDVVEPALLTDKTAKLFEKFGLQEFKDDTVVSSILTKCSENRWIDWSDQVRWETLSYVKEWVLAREGDISASIMRKLPNILVPLRGGGWDGAINCYFADKRLEELIPNIRVVDDYLTRDSEWVRFLELAEVKKYPRVIHFAEKRPIHEMPGPVSRDDWLQYIIYSPLYEVRRIYSKEESISDVKLLDGFDEAIRTRDEARLKSYLEHLCLHWDEYYSKHLTSCYGWVTSSGYYHSESGWSYFLYQLKDRAWLPTNEGLKKPKESSLPLKDLKKVFGSLIPYALLPEELLDKSLNFAKTIGINTSAEKNRLIFALNRAKLFRVDNELKKSLEKIYTHLVLFSEGEKFDEIELLCEDGKFGKTSDIYWNDAPEVGQCLSQPPSFVWVPQLGRPQLVSLFKALGIRKLSESIDIQKEPISSKDVICRDTELERMIQEKLTYFHSILLDARMENPQQIIESLKSLRVIRVKVLRYTARLGQESALMEKSVLYDRSENTLYLREQAESSDIALEFVRTFSIPPAYALHIGLVSEQVEYKSIESQLTKFGIRIVEYPKALEEAQEVRPEPEIKEQEERKGEQFGRPQVIDKRTFETRESLERAAEDIFAKERQPLDLGDLGKPPPDVKTDRTVVSPPKLMVYESKKIYASLNLQSKQVSDLTLLITPNMPEPAIEKIKAFALLLRKIVACMGASPDRVMIIVTDEKTEARDLSPEYPGRIGFNAILIERSPIFWMVVAARELAGLRYKEHYPHVKAMSQLIEKGLEHLHEIDPDFINRIKPIGNKKSVSAPK